jgi:hypothetical protein
MGKNLCNTKVRKGGNYPPNFVKLKKEKRRKQKEKQRGSSTQTGPNFEH